MDEQIVSLLIDINVVNSVHNDHIYNLFTNVEPTFEQILED